MEDKVFEGEKVKSLRAHVFGKIIHVVIEIVQDYDRNGTGESDRVSGVEFLKGPQQK